MHIAKTAVIAGVLIAGLIGRLLGRNGLGLVLIVPSAPSPAWR
ncbi:hypothetical protein [Actinomadura sp. DC4]|nr:hypothetical protein [Actinomadura sp. DC4]MDN3353613.1 hypothetical protein [Actinomadura sp. DC4]